MGYFLHFYPSNSPKNQNLKNEKETPGDIAILHKCTKNHDHILHCSWDMACDTCNFYFSFWAIFCYFSPPPPPTLTAQKITNFQKNSKNAWRYHHFTQVDQKTWSYAILFLRYVVWQMQLLVFILWLFFALLPLPLTPQKMKI